MKVLIKIIFYLFLITAMNAQSINLPIVPTPKIVKPTGGFFHLKDNLTFTVTDSADENSYTVQIIQRTLKNFQRVSSTIRKIGDIEISYIKNDEQDHVLKNLSDEGYLLRISEKIIELKAKTSKGIYYAAVSLIQLLEKAGGKLDCVEIIDWPDMKIRGISDDISRGQVSNLENFKKIISHIARYKMNTYMPYIEDVLEFEKYPTIGKNRGALTKAEAKEIIAFAKQNFVEVIPIFQTLGHYENILSQEEFLKYAEFSGAASLNVSDDATYSFLEDLLKEVFELFPSEYFHMGADESWDVGLGASKKLVQETNIAVVHANHYKKVYDICKKYNKKVMMYGDILLDHPEILSLIPKDIIIVDWQYRADEYYPSTKIISDAGFEYLVSPSVWNFTSTFPVNINSLPNIKYIIKSGLENNSFGMINSNWGDYGAETFKEFVLFNYAWSAQCSWDFAQSDLDKFSRNYFYDFYGIDDEKTSNIYAALSNPLNQIIWHEIWRHPLLKFREPAWWESKTSKAVKITWNDLTLTNLHKVIKELKAVVKKNSDHLQLLEFHLNLNNWYKLKVETQFELQRVIKEKFFRNEPDLLNLINENIEALDVLKIEYRKLWPKYYKADNLNMIEDKFERLIAYFQEIKESIHNQSLLSFNPLISSKWLYFKNDDSSYARRAEFTTSFDLTILPEEAELQLMGDSYVQLYINEKLVEKVFARRSLSLLVDYKRIKFIEIKPFLVEGKNSFRIIAENFSPKGGAGFNLIAKLNSDGEETLLLSDDTDRSMLKWLARDMNSDSWREAVSKTYPFEVIAPNFKTKRISWIER